jgi:hypothetical protein
LIIDGMAQWTTSALYAAAAYYDTVMLPVGF